MSLFKYVELVCDGPACYAKWLANAVETSSGARQRESARRDGEWLVSKGGGMDFCSRQCYDNHIGAAAVGLPTKLAGKDD